MEQPERRQYSFDVPFIYLLTPEAEAACLEKLEFIFGSTDDPQARLRKFLRSQLFGLVRPRMTTIDFAGVDLDLFLDAGERPEEQVD